MIPQLVSTTETVDFVFLFIFAISAAMLLGITATTIYFVVRYRRAKNPRPTSETASNLWLEVVWTVIPTLLVLAMFYYGWAGYLALRNVPEDALEVKVTGRMWSWLFEYENGRTSDRLFVPAGRPVRVRIVSEDVLHSFFIPAFRVKRDAVPGMETYLWFTAPQTGSYDIFCAEYCGRGHADMITTVEALPQHEFAEWLQGETVEDEAGEGKKLLAKYGCTACHSLDGTKSVGPTFQGIFGRRVTVVTEGEERSLTADEDYLRSSILRPRADLVKGYPPVMPAFEGKIPEHDLEEIIEFFRKEAGGKGSSHAGEKLLREKGCLGCHSSDGSKSVGPTLKGLLGREVTVEKGGKTVSLTADAEYVRRAIRHPQEEIVKGYPPVMPPFADLSEEEMEAILETLRNLR